MDKDELKTIVDSEGIRPDSYIVGGSGAYEQWVLTQENEEWVVYYAEKGQRTGLKRFTTEHDACSYLLERLRKDPGTRR